MAASSTVDSSSARTSSPDIIFVRLTVNPIKMPNFPGPTNQMDVLEGAYSYFKKLPESQFDGIVKNNVIDIMKSLHGLQNYWMEKFHKEEIDGKERAAKIEEQKNANIEALERRIAKLIAESIAIESENQQNGSASKERDVTYFQLNEENKFLKNQNAELAKKLKNENSCYDSLEIRYNSRKEDLKNVEKACNELKELNATLKAKNEENVLKINELEEELKNAQQSLFARDDEIEKMELQHKKYLQSEMQDYAEKEKTLNEKCSIFENEIVELKRMNGGANDEIVKLQEKLQEMKKESESKMKILTEKEQSLKEKCSILENEKSESQKNFVEMNQNNEEYIAELQLKMDKLEANKQSLIEKISVVESAENEKFEELNQKYAELEIKADETEKSLTIANNEIIILKEKLNSAEMNEKLNALEEEKQKLKAKIVELETSFDDYKKELHETRSNYNDLLLKEQQSSRRITFENVEQAQNVATVPGDAINGQLHDQAQNFEAHNNFMVFENNQFKNSNSSSRTSFATLKTEYEKLQKRLFSIDEYLKKYGTDPLPSVEKYQSDVEQINKKLEDAKNSASLKHALLIQQNVQHNEEKKFWITIFNNFCVKMKLLKNENAQLFGELKYYREAFSSGSGSGNDEVVVPTKRKRKSLNPQRKEVQQQQPNITEKLPDSKKNDIQFPAPENFASNNPGSSTQLNFL